MNEVTELSAAEGLYVVAGITLATPALIVVGGFAAAIALGAAAVVAGPVVAVGAVLAVGIGSTYVVGNACGMCCHDSMLVTSVRRRIRNSTAWSLLRSAGIHVCSA